MKDRLRLASWLLVWTLLAAPAAAQELRGRRVSDVLDELRSAGLTFIYNTRILPSDLRIETEPQAKEGVDLAREILAARGLSLSQVAPGVFAVVAGSMPPTPAAPAQPAAGGVEEVVVQTSRYRLATNEVATRTFLTQEQVKNMPRLADETLRAVQRLPGTTTNGFSSISSVRGGEPNETAIVLDGLRLYEPFHLKNFLSPVSLLDSRLIDSLEFYSGGFPVEYGDRMSAIIDATTVRPMDPRYFEIGLNLFHASALAALQFDGGRGHVLLSGRRSNVGDLAHLSENDFGEPQYSDGFGRVDYEFSDDAQASLEALVSSDTIVARQQSGQQQARAKYRNIYAWATLDHDVAERRVVAADRVVYGSGESPHGRPVDEPGVRTAHVRDERLFHIVGLRVENNLDTGSLQHRFGAEVRRLWGDYDYSNQVHAEPGFPFPRIAGVRHDALGRAFARRIRELRLLGRAYAGRRALDLRRRRAHQYANLRRLRRRRAMEPACERALHAVAADALAREPWPLRAIPGHQRAAGGGRCRHLLRRAARASRDRRLRSLLRRRPRSARRGVPQGVPAHQPALRESSSIRWCWCRKRSSIACASRRRARSRRGSS